MSSTVIIADTVFEKQQSDRQMHRHTPLKTLSPRPPSAWTITYFMSVIHMDLNPQR